MSNEIISKIKEICSNKKQSNLEQNIEVVASLLSFLQENPNLRFNQALHILYKGDLKTNLDFYQSPKETLKLFDSVS